MACCLLIRAVSEQSLRASVSLSDCRVPANADRQKPERVWTSMRYSLFEDGHDEEGVSEEMGRPRAAAAGNKSYEDFLNHHN